jgi:hypothetical protein
MTSSPNWQQFVRVANLEAAMDLMQPELTHYQAENMKRPAKITSSALGMVPTWMKKPREGHDYWWRAYGGTDLGCAPPGLSLSVLAVPVADAEKKQRLVRAAIRDEGVGDIQGYLRRSTVRVMLPVGHALGEASAMASWLQSLALLKNGNFDSIESSYGVSAWPELERETERLEKASCSRYPGLDAFRESHAGQVRADPAYPDLIPLVRRAAWTNVLHELTVQELGGEAKVREQFADTPEVRLMSFEHGLIIQAGERPALGDLNRGDLLPLVRKVAQVMRPVRAHKLAAEAGEADEFWAHFFSIFDRDHS